MAFSTSFAPIDPAQLATGFTSSFKSLAPRLAIQGALAPFARAAPDLYANAVTTVYKQRANALKNTYRRQARAAGLGERFGNTMRVEYPRGPDPSLDFTAVVRSVALLREDAGGRRRWTRLESAAEVDLWTVFDQGTVIRADSEHWLAIPLTFARSASDRRLTPQDFPAGHFIVVQPPNEQNPLLIEESTGVAFFVLVRDVVLRKRLNLGPPAARAQAGLADSIVKGIETALVKFLRAQKVAA